MFTNSLTVLVHFLGRFGAQGLVWSVFVVVEQVLCQFGLEVGEVELRMPYNPALTQQHGFIHAGVVSTALDSACGYAAFSLMPAEAAVLTVEFKVNLLSPAKGARFSFVGKVVKPGRTVTVAEGEAFAWDGGESKRIARMNATLMTVTGRAGVDG